VSVKVTFRTAAGVSVGSVQLLTNQLGVVSDSDPAFGSYQGRKFVASAAVGGQTVKQKRYAPEPSAPYDSGVSGVVTNMRVGTVTFSSPARRFSPFSVNVMNGAFVAPILDSFAGQILVTYAGSGKTAKRRFTQDASAYQFVLTAH
jgi:hypothetical protein